MSANAVASIQYSNVPGFPAGSAVDHIEVTVQGAAPGALPITQSVPPDTASVTFTALADDTYTVTVEAVDAANSVFGTPVTGSFTSSTVGSTVTLSLPASVTAAQQ
jgi:hypothetical protein